MICRIWHGWTSPANADAYERLLRTEIFHTIAARGIRGYQGIELLRRPAGDSVEFVTLMWFESLDAVRAFAGPDYEVAVVPPGRGLTRVCSRRAGVARPSPRAQRAWARCGT